ncbi:DNA topoisomerase IB [Sinorhizobium sp. BG8]|uniref:DNA topoisomerase IB n=1 Tax=Sinorhizobium sp. BG8 TaxID=2613773 RepID=UPI00193D9D87|nr:DNA topoisomerase IB [Sinorhizobium sp. BG8]QRM57389.1 DNA topoisomerase IB [Sinorhizobium sp. BG8]
MFATISSSTAPFTDTGLVYVSDSQPGIKRRRKGRGFCYTLPDGSLLKDPTQRARIAALGLPPAYENVWICLEENGHLQATGLDARGRKQYRYHKDWQALRSGDKFGQLIAFGKALPRIRRCVARHAEGVPGEMTTVLAALTMLLDDAHLRVGNRSYTEQNNTYGATTLLKRHLRIVDGSAELRFMAKGGKRVRRILRRPRLQRLLEAIADLPGHQLFVWRDNDGAVRPIDSGRLNGYLAEIARIPVSAKTFRTWAGSVAAYAAAASALNEGRRPTIKEMAEAAAAVLHNTPAICRSSYIHPHILELAGETMPVGAKARGFSVKLPKGLLADENRMLQHLIRRLRRRPCP